MEFLPTDTSTLLFFLEEMLKETKVLFNDASDRVHRLRAEFETIRFMDNQEEKDMCYNEYIKANEEFFKINDKYKSIKRAIEFNKK